MAPKKKKAEEMKKKIVEDKTFGLKNKKKSKKMQQYVETVKKQANQKVDGPKKNRDRLAGSAGAGSVRMAQMAARLAELELMNKQSEVKGKKMSKEEEERKRLEDEAEHERIRIANLPIEDQIEEERVKLTSRTPVTLELFLEWKKEKDRETKVKKDAEKAIAFKKMSKAERSRGQGFTGRELFQSNADIFVDDEEADATTLKASSNYIGSDNEDEKQDDPEVAAAEAVEPEDLSLFGGDDNGAGPADLAQQVDIGDESLFQ